MSQIVVPGRGLDQDDRGGPRQGERLEQPVDIGLREVFENTAVGEHDRAWLRIRRQPVPCLGVEEGEPSSWVLG